MNTYQEEETCTAPLPDGIEIYSARFTGEGRARCLHCNFVCGYWDCACELEHDCEGEEN